MNVIDLHTMQREEGISSPLSVALGNFDGVHKGHAELIRRAAGYASEHKIKSAVWTFSDSSQLPNKPEGKLITDTAEKLLLMRGLGADFAILEDFESVRNLSPGAFVNDILIKKCRAAAAVCGFNFRFGAGGAGDALMLRSLMGTLDTVIVDPIYENGMIVSSSAIRTLIESGDMEKAAALLGRPFSISLPVIEGKRLGRTIGIPTVNQNFSDGHIVPRSGIYASMVDVDGRCMPGVTNVGVRPTVESGKRALNCETHIIGYDGCLYGKTLKISFYKRLRDEKQFDSIELLRRQISKDIEIAVNYFEA